MAATNDTLPAGPWSYLTTAAPGTPDGNGHVYLVDADGKKLASLWGKPDQKMALAKLFIAARGEG
jgi:hypothetical protein